MRLRPVLPVLAVLTALTLTACDDSSSASGGTVGDPATPSSAPTTAVPTPTAPDPSAPDPSPSSSATRPPPPKAVAGTTAPGTVLAYGEPAVVTVFASGNPNAKLEYTVTNVKVGQDDSGFGGRIAQITIKVRAIDDVTNALALALIDWEGTDENGNKTVFGLVDGCDDELPVAKAGETGTMCVAVSLTGNGTSITAVQYDSGAYREEPIIWKP